MKTQNPWMGRARKSAGGMTATKMYSSNVLRSKPIEVANPNTQAQQTQRNFFKQLTACTNEVPEEVLRTLFPKTPAKRSRRSELAKQIAGYNDTVGTTKSLVFESAPQVGNGKIGAIDASEIIPGSGEDETQINWDENEFEGLTSAEKQSINAVVVVFDNEVKKMKVINSDVTLDTNKITLDNKDLPNGINTDSTELSAIVTYSELNDNVYLRGFGSFTVKRRAQKTGRTPQH